MRRLPELQPTPIRGRHPLVYGAGFLLLVSLIAFLARAAAPWVFLTAALAVLMAVLAFVIALRRSGGSP
ncbi:MAG: hypothetical protein ABR537_00280 [Gemmatimonadales bacterium]